MRDIQLQRDFSDAWVRAAHNPDVRIVSLHLIGEQSDQQTVEHFGNILEAMGTRLNYVFLGAVKPGKAFPQMGLGVPKGEDANNKISFIRAVVASYFADKKSQGYSLQIAG